MNTYVYVDTHIYIYVYAYVQCYMPQFQVSDLFRAAGVICSHGLGLGLGGLAPTIPRVSVAQLCGYRILSPKLGF